MPRKDQLVCFDLGGVLVEIRHSWADALLAIDLSAESRHQVHLNTFPDFLVYQDGLIGEEEYASKLGDWLGVTPDQALQAHRAILDRDYPGAFDLTSELKSLGTPTACFSNTNALHWKLLTSEEFHPAVAVLDYKFASHEIGLAKPMVAAFQAVDAKMPEHASVIFFDDSFENVEAANRSGWQAYRVDPFSDPVGAMRATLNELGVLGAR